LESEDGVSDGNFPHNFNLFLSPKNLSKLPQSSKLEIAVLLVPILFLSAAF
jgi:hypothetical protein